MEQPSDDLVKFFAKKVYDGVVDQKVIDKYTPLVKSAFSQIVADRLNIKVQALQTAINDEIKEAEKNLNKQTIETTEDEITASMIIRAMSAKVCPVDSITMRDSQSYYAVLFNDNNRKPIARLHFNSQTVKYISTFDIEGQETKHKMSNIQDIYGFQEQILEAVNRYL